MLVIFHDLYMDHSEDEIKDEEDRRYRYVWYFRWPAA